MHILFVCDEYPPASYGGIGVFVRMLAEALARRGIPVTVVGQYDGLSTDQMEESVGVRVYRLRKSSLPKIGILANRLSLYRWIERFVREHKVDVVEYPDFQSDLWRRHSIPTVLRLHGSALFYAMHGCSQTTAMQAFLERHAVGVAVHIVGVSRYVLDFTLTHIREVPRAATRVLYNFVDTALFNPDSAGSESNVILFFGTLVSKKGVLGLARAANVFLRELAEAELHFIGRDGLDGSQACSGQILELLDPEVRSRVKLREALPHACLPREIRAARFCVLPSHMESFGLAIAEAMACGKAVISSDRGPLPEIIRHGHDGILVNPDDTNDLARRVIELYRNEGERRRLGMNALATVRERFAMKEQVDANLRFYREIAGRT